MHKKIFITQKRYDKAQYDEKDENCFRERKIRRNMKESGHINTCIDMYNVSKEGARIGGNSWISASEPMPSASPIRSPFFQSGTGAFRVPECL
jgi:hypothetical protein